MEGEVKEVTPVVVETPVAALPQPDPKELQLRIDQLTKDVETAKHEALKHQQTASKHAERAAKQEDALSGVAKLETQLAVNTEMLAEILDSREVEGFEDKPKKRRSEDFLERLKKSQEQVQESQNKTVQEKVWEADKLIKSVGLDMEKSPELHKAFVAFVHQDVDGMMEEVQKVVDAKKTEATKATETDEQVRTRLKFELLKDESFRREVLESLNLTKEKVVPSTSGRVFTRKEIAVMPMDEFEKIKPEADKACREGKIK